MKVELIAGNVVEKVDSQAVNPLMCDPRSRQATPHLSRGSVAFDHVGKA